MTLINIVLFYLVLIIDLSFAQDDERFMTVLHTKFIGYRLPNDTIPRSYNLHLEPHIDAENFTFDGQSDTTFDVIYPTRDVTLHASHLLEIDKSYTKLILHNETILEPIAQRWNPVLEFFNIHFEHELTIGSYILKLKWLGHEALNKKGFYRGRDKNKNGEYSVMVATHFQATAARSAFPCWDEPGLKAEFEISIKHHNNRTALSNMPIKYKSDAGDNKIWSHFEKSPLMSTYLVTFILADYEHIDHTNNKNMTFWTTKDNLMNIQLALNVSQNVISLMEEYTGISYSLPKLDQITIPQYTSGATEHWGMISYMKPAVSFDIDEDDIPKRDGSILLTIHENVHQWFGNLVTPAWWSDLWLSEAFAVYFSYKIVDQIFENWYGKDLFVGQIVNKISFHADFWYRGKHPIKWNPESPDDITQLFSPVTYRKGAAVLFMLENILSENIFRNGIVKYLNKHQFDSVITDDLWESLQKAYDEEGGYPHLDIKEIMDPWLEQTGYPLLNVTRDYETELMNITQINALDPKSKNFWIIPITLTTRTLMNFTNTRPSHWIRHYNECLALHGINKDDWIIVNIQQTGFYRINYDYDNWKRLVEYLNTDNYHKIHVGNRAQLINDLSFLALYEDKYSELLIHIISYLHREINYLPWIPALMVVERFNSILINTPAYDIFEQFILHLISNITNHIGFDNQLNENHLYAIARHEIVPWACAFGHISCINAARNKLLLYLQDSIKYPILPGTKRWIYCHGLMYANHTIWDIVMKHFENLSDELNYEFLGCTNNHDIMREYLSLLLSKNDALHTEGLTIAFLSIIVGKRENVDFVIDYFINHIDEIRQYFDMRGLTRNIYQIAEHISKYIKNDDQYNKFKRFLEQQERYGKMSNIKQLMNIATVTKAESEKFSTNFLTIVHNNPSSFEFLHRPT